MSKQHELEATEDELTLLFTMVRAEIMKAQAKFPAWPDDLLHGFAILAEESGEAQRAVLQVVYQNGMVEAYRTELIQTAAMAVRTLLDIHRRYGFGWAKSEVKEPDMPQRIYPDGSFVLGCVRRTRKQD